MTLFPKSWEGKMPEAVAPLDPTIPYWPGSPFGGPNANSMIAGDMHDCTVWHGMPQCQLIERSESST